MAVDLTLRLLRHGRTEWSDGGRYCGHNDVPLSADGRLAVASIELPSAEYRSVLSSDLMRCLETASLLNLTPVIEPSLREFDFGLMEGQTWSELAEPLRVALGDYDKFTAPGGESVAEFRDRVETFVDALPSGLHLVVTHGGVIQHLLWREGVDRRLGPGEWTDLRITRR